jgi:hypothetical protein
VILGDIPREVSRNQTPASSPHDDVAKCRGASGAGRPLHHNAEYLDSSHIPNISPAVTAAAIDRDVFGAQALTRRSLPSHEPLGSGTDCEHSSKRHAHSKEEFPWSERHPLKVASGRSYPLVQENVLKGNSRPNIPGMVQTEPDLPGVRRSRGHINKNSDRSSPRNSSDKMTDVFRPDQTKSGDSRLIEALQPTFHVVSSLGSGAMKGNDKSQDERMNLSSDNLNDWEHVISMYFTGQGTPDGRPLKSIVKGEGHKILDRKLLEKRRTIGKTYETLGKQLFDRAIGYTFESGQRRKRKMYQVIARCRAVNAIRKDDLQCKVPEDPDELDSLISYYISQKSETRLLCLGPNSE